MRQVMCCYYCKTERHPGCHATCERYKAEKAAREAEQESIRRKKSQERSMESYQRAAADRLRRAK